MAMSARPKWGQMVVMREKVNGKEMGSRQGGYALRVIVITWWRKPN